MKKKRNNKFLIFLSIIILAFIGALIIIFANNKKTDFSNDDSHLIEYKIINDEEIIKKLKIDDIVEIGYKIIESNEDYYLIISGGEMLSCCGNLEVRNVKTDTSTITVEVEYYDICDCLPDKITHPKVVIKLNKKPHNVNINNDSYSEILEISEEKLLIKIADVSQKCLSNQVKIYSDNKYQVISSVGDQIIKEGNLNYSKDFDILIDKIKKYKMDSKNHLNYDIVFNDNTKTTVAINKAHELNELLDLISIENKFWCE